MNNMNVHKNAYSGGIKKRIGRSDLRESGASRAKARACTPKCVTARRRACTLKRFGAQAWLSAQEGKFYQILIDLIAQI
jgi:hypothetical protein